ncbi:MAG: hypothetical protein AAF696_22060 [Bacteroidota bacterium]
MDTQRNIRELLIEKIHSVPEGVLKELYNYLLRLEKQTSAKERIISFAGAWSDMDNQEFEELLELNRKRRKGE